MKVLFNMVLGQTTGFVERLPRLIGIDWNVPHFSKPGRRQKSLAVSIPHLGSQGPLHLLIESAGIRVMGEGEWNARKHAGPKRRVWRKIHLGIDEETLEIWAVQVTSRDVGDAPLLPELLNQIPPDQAIPSVTADRAYDTRQRHDAIADRGPGAIIPLAGIPSHGMRPPQARSPATRRCGRRNILVARSGDDGAATTAEAALK